MKILNRYIVFSILKVALLTALLASLIMLGVDLFGKLDIYVSNNVSGSDIFRLTILYFPAAFLMVTGPAVLFSVTYFLSMLHARNEIICILNSGINYARVIITCIITALGISLFCFFFSETVKLECENRRNVLYESVTDTSSSSGNSSAVALSDMYRGYSVYTDHYVDGTKTLLNVVIIEKTPEGSIRRTNAESAQWNEEEQCWNLSGVTVYTVQEDGTVQTESRDSLLNRNFSLKPQLFRNSSADISTMDLLSASDYVLSMKVVNPEKYASLATELYKRVFESLAPLVFAIIACSMNYRYKKNVLFISIVSSVAVAVVYYVCQIVTNLFANQGIIAPYMGSLFPLLLILALSVLIAATRKI
ncbi:MAG: LptF/LptG family permease [Sphaerochaetaceae bacterium]|nr:LptF/LptG family permease [Sphaerochaetaceae bacterium]